MCVCSIMYAQKVEKVKEYNVSLERVSKGAPGNTNINNERFLNRKEDVLFFIKNQPTKPKNLANAINFKNSQYLIVKVTGKGEEVVKGLNLTKGQNQYELRSVIHKGDKVFLLGELNNTNRYELSLFKLNTTTYEIMENVVLVSDTEGNHKYLEPFVESSVDLKKTFIATKRYVDYKEGSYLQHLIVLGEEGSVINSVKTKEVYSNVEGVKISDNGEMFAYGAKVTGKNKKGQLFFYKYSKSGTAESYVYQVPEGIVLQFNRQSFFHPFEDWADAKYGTINVINNHLIYDVPYYSLNNESEVGIMTLDMDANSFTNGKVKHYKYGKHIMGDLLQIHKYQDIHKVIPNKLSSVMFNNGDRVVVADLVYKYRVGELDKYRAGDIIVLKITAEGDVLWSKLFPRKNFGTTDEEWTQTLVVKNEDNINLFLNDYTPNNLLAGKHIHKNGMKYLQEMVLKQLVIDKDGNTTQYDLEDQTSSLRDGNFKMLLKSIILEGELIFISKPYHYKNNPLITFYKFK